MYYLQSYTKSVINDKIVEACGDRSVLIADGRYRQDDYEPEAIEHARERTTRVYTLLYFQGRVFYKVETYY